MYSITSLQPILDAFTHQSQRGVTELSHFLHKDRTLIQRYLKYLVESGQLIKVGKGSHVEYTLKQKPYEPAETFKKYDPFSISHIDILNTYFLKYSPSGKKLIGKQGFIERCTERNLSPNEKIHNFVSIAQHLEKIRNKHGLIDVTKDFRNNIEGSAIDELYFADQYKRMEFGRGKLAELTFFAKSSSKIGPIQECIMLIKDRLESLIHDSKIDAIAFAPHSMKRPIQLLKETQKMLDIAGIPIIKLVKYAPYGTIVAQKTLKSREQRIQNAKDTILIELGQHIEQYHTVLLIDDFVGSGSTLNETAKKLKAQGVKKVIAFAFVGNANLSYEVINEI